MRVLVTGAAGLLGGEICARLAREGHEVTGLVHRNRDIRANDGSPVEIATIAGDVSVPSFGWEESEFARLATSHDLLVHCAATVRFDLNEADYAAVNVDGTKHALAFARQGGMDFLHVSTAYVCGKRDGAILEGDPLPEAGFANGYEASKAAGERLVRASGLRWAVARPSIVVGAYESGAIRQFDTTYAAFKLIAEGRVKHMPARAGATLDFVPIDHVAAGILALAHAMEQAAGKTFHLVSAHPLPVTDFTGAIGEFAQFHEPELVEPSVFDPSTLPALERRLFKRVAGLYASYFQRDPHFEDANVREILGMRCPKTGRAYIHRLIEHCIEVGFLTSN